MLAAVAAAADRARQIHEKRIDAVVVALSPQLEDDEAWTQAVRSGATLLAGPVPRRESVWLDVEEMARVLLEEVKLGERLNARRPDAFRAAARNVLYRVRNPQVIARHLEECIDDPVLKLEELDVVTAEVAACMTSAEWDALRAYARARGKPQATPPATLRRHTKGPR
ncbi:MAG TPA: hypothetical protein VHA82_07395 [Ramlibacter sp.]|nr:hypothetical protein [Ramlibacter sp.]